MKKSDLKRLVRTAYAVEPSVRKAEFIKKYQFRELNYLQILSMQFQYMGPQLALLCGCVLAVLLGAAVNVSENFARFIAVLVPVAALIAMTGLGRSSAYAMDEIEMSSRFSLRTLRIMRIGIVGIAGLFVMLAVSCALKILTGAAFLPAVAFAAVPYLLTTFLSMLLIRHWHSPHNIYGCAVIAGCISVLALGRMEALLLCSSLLYAALPVLIALTAAEFCRYIKESEELQWNLC